ncbi:hypothetical protein RD792_017058 [Penstemon davidsonii]|uniref:Uncharacterized protein n=1 Tax=Penstemon davidsonii TaxID=160366 RepID=A0ABR0CKY8_9LAMI|nr:hypothetical protein RD792_017058 [Penstemon davidsonii]
MSRDNAHLVNAEGDLNETGKRYLALKKEWLSRAHGLTNEECQFEFKGFHGSYQVEIVDPFSGKKGVKTFVVDQGIRLVDFSRVKSDEFDLNQQSIHQQSGIDQKVITTKVQQNCTLNSCRSRSETGTNTRGRSENPPHFNGHNSNLQV